MRSEAWHELLRTLEGLPELDQLRIELIDGKIVMQASAAPFHNRIVSDLAAQFGRKNWEALPGQTLISSTPGFEPKADLTVTTFEKIEDNRNPLPADRVDLVVEVVSTDKDCDYTKKRMWYAMSEIPLYLLVDPNDGSMELCSDPDPHKLRYRTSDPFTFGDPVELPDPFGFSLDTTQFKLYPPKPRR